MPGGTGHIIDVHDDARIALTKSVDEMRKQRVGCSCGRANSNFSSLRIGQGFDVSNSQPQFIKGRPTAREQGAAVGRGFDSAPCAIEQPGAQAMLQIRYNLRDGRLRHTKLSSSLGQAP